MEFCPCICDCGSIFDLHEGFESIGGNGNVVCADCHNEQMEDLKNDC